MDSPLGNATQAPPRQSACGRPVRALAPGANRPSDMLASFFFAGIAFMAAGAFTALLTAVGVAGEDGHWIALHLMLLGGISQLLIGAAQFFSTAYLATDPPSRSMVRAQLAVWFVATVMVAAGLPLGLPLVTDVGGALVLSGLALFAISLRRLEQRSLQTARWTIRWYYGCAISLGGGAVLGIAMAQGVVWTHGSLLGAHLALNLAGWLGAAIVGTLHTFYPSLTNSRLRHQRLQGPTFVSWYTGVAALAIGEAFGQGALASAGWIALAAGSLMLVVNLAGTALDAQGPLSLAGRIVGGAQLFLPAGLIVALAMIADVGPTAALTDPWRSALAILLLAGWIGLTVAGSLLHLLTVLHRVRNLMLSMPAPHRVRDIWITSLLCAAIAAFALAQVPEFASLERPAMLAALAAAIPVVAQILTLAVKAIPRPARFDRSLA